MKAYKELLFLSKLNGVGPTRIRKNYANLLEKGIDFQELCELVRKIEVDVSEDNLIRASKFASDAYSNVSNRTDISVFTILDKDYPVKLMDLGVRAPLTVHVKGDASLLSKPTISVIGTREPCEWSQKIEPRLVNKILEYHDFVIASGLAVGCDMLGHEACMERAGKTIAVLPSGFDHVYPSDNLELSHRIVERGGALISEYAPIEKATRYSFIARDAVLAALSEAILIMECGTDNGIEHIIDAAVKLKKKIAVYEDNSRWKKYYVENRNLITNRLAYGFSDTDELYSFLDTVSKEEISESVFQMSLFDTI